MAKVVLETDRVAGAEGAGQTTQGAPHQGVLRDYVDRQAALQGGGVVRQPGYFQQLTRTMKCSGAGAFSAPTAIS